MTAAGKGHRVEAINFSQVSLRWNGNESVLSQCLYIYANSKCIHTDSLLDTRKQQTRRQLREAKP